MEGGGGGSTFRERRQSLEECGTHRKKKELELSEAERAVLEPPYAYSRPLVGDDGVTVVRRNAADCPPSAW